MKPALALALALGVLPLAGCYQVGAAGKTNRIELVGSSVVDGYKFDQYRNLSYPCSISGYQTFVIGTKVGSSDTPTRPLWVRMRGGGVGWFDSSGNPQPSAGNKSEESAATSIGFVRTPASWPRARRPGRVPAAVGVDVQPRHLLGRRPARPQQPEHDARRSGRGRSTGCSRPRRRSSSRARSPDGKFFLHGTSAGGGGACRSPGVCSEQGIPPAGSVVDSGGEHEWEHRRSTSRASVPATAAPPEALAASRPARIRAGRHQERARQAGQQRRADRAAPPHLEPGRRRTPAARRRCSCPLRDGSTATLGSPTASTSRCAPRSPGSVRAAGRATCACARARPRRAAAPRTGRRTRTAQHRPGRAGRLQRGDLGLGARAAGRPLAPGARWRREALTAAMMGDRARGAERGVAEVSQPWVDKVPGPPRDAVIGDLARRQHGVVSLHQLQLAGLGRAAVAKRVAAGRLYRIHRAVYAVGHDRLTAHGRTMAAVLAYGPRAVASHRSAGGLHGLRPDNRATTEIALPQPRPARGRVSTPTLPQRSAPATSRNAPAFRVPASLAPCSTWPTSSRRGNSSGPWSRPRCCVSSIWPSWRTCWHMPTAAAARACCAPCSPGSWTSLGSPRATSRTASSTCAARPASPRRL